jgi:DNA-binding transcriptional ArsR family regulator
VRGAIDSTEARLYFPYQLISFSGKCRGRAVTLTMDDDRLSETFAALANSTRRSILARLARGAATVNELAEPFEMTLPAISKHIKALERAGLVVRGQRAQYRPCALDAAPLEEVSTWAEQYRPVWEGRFDRMDDYLRQLRPQRKTGELDG